MGSRWPSEFYMIVIKIVEHSVNYSFSPLSPRFCTSCPLSSCPPFSDPFSSSDDPAVGERYSGGGPRAGRSPQLWDYCRVPRPYRDLVTLPGPPTPQCSGPGANALLAGGHSRWCWLLQLQRCQQRGQPCSQECQPHRQEWVHVSEGTGWFDGPAGDLVLPSWVRQKRLQQHWALMWILSERQVKYPSCLPPLSLKHNLFNIPPLQLFLAL